MHKFKKPKVELIPSKNAKPILGAFTIVLCLGVAAVGLYLPFYGEESKIKPKPQASSKSNSMWKNIDNKAKGAS